MKFYLKILFGILLILLLIRSAKILNKNSPSHQSPENLKRNIGTHGDDDSDFNDVSTDEEDKAKKTKGTPVTIKSSNEPATTPTFSLAKNIILIPAQSYNKSFAGNEIVFRFESVKNYINNKIQVKMLDSNGNFEKNMNTFKQKIKEFEKNFTILFSEWVKIFRNSKETNLLYLYDDIFQPFILLVSDSNIVLNRNTVSGINTITASKGFLNLCSLLFLDQNRQIDKKVTDFWLNIFELTNV
jgi:hypothetical protein